MGMQHLVGVSVATEGETLSNEEWMRRSDVRRIFGIGKDILDKWVEVGAVEAHKLNPSKNGTVVFSTRDIRDTIRTAPLWKPRKTSGKNF